MSTIDSRLEGGKFMMTNNLHCFSKFSCIDDVKLLITRARLYALLSRQVSGAKESVLLLDRPDER